VTKRSRGGRPVGWLGVSMTLAAGLAQAQEAPVSGADDANALEEVLVTGYRASLQSAIEAKRSSNEIVDVIDAEDIGDFPDANLAESLQRLPGVSIERDGGEGRSITVRGLGGDFTRVRLNGLETLSTSGASGSGTSANRGRGFDFNVFASELFRSLKVRKTVAAEIDEGSLGATVDLQTGRPFDFGGFAAAASAQAAYYELGSETRPRLAALVSNTWLDERVGALFSVAYSERYSFEEGYDSGNSDYTSANGGFGEDGSDPESYALISSYDAFAPRLPRLRRSVNDQSRLGITGSFQLRPAEATELSLDWVFSRFEQDRHDQYLEAISFNRNNLTSTNLEDPQRWKFIGRPYTTVSDVSMTPQNELAYGVFDNVDVRTENYQDYFDTEFSQLSLLLDQQLGDRLKLSALVGRSTSDFDNPHQRMASLDIFDVQNFVYDARRGKMPRLDWGFDPTDPSNWTFTDDFSELRHSAQTIDNAFTTYRLDVDWTMTDQWSLKVGASRKKYVFKTESFRMIKPTTEIPALPAGTGIADVSNMLSGFGDGMGAVQTRWLTPDIAAFRELFHFDCNCVYTTDDGQVLDFTMGSTDTNSRGDNRGVDEIDDGGYLQVDFVQWLADMRLRGNLGLRYTHTDQSSWGWNNATTYLTADRRYDDWLPALNLTLEITPDLLARFGAAKAMARPQLGNVTPTASIDNTGNEEDPTPTVSGGNPDLDPYRTDNLDLALEWYFSDEALLSASLFWKKINNFPQRIRSLMPYRDTGLPESLLNVGADGTLNTMDTEFWVTAYINGPGGTLRGAEFSYQQPFSFLPSPFNRFGAQTNFTWIESEIDYVLAPDQPDLTLSAPLFNVSPRALNATLYYEADRWSARISAAWREEYVRNAPTRSGSCAPAQGPDEPASCTSPWVDDLDGSSATLGIDAAARWQLSDQLSLTLDALNLTDSFDHRWSGESRRADYGYYHSGRQIFMGLRWRY